MLLFIYKNGTDLKEIIDWDNKFESMSRVDHNKTISSVDSIVVVGNVDGIADDAPEDEDGQDGDDHVQRLAPFLDSLHNFMQRV